MEPRLHGGVRRQEQVRPGTILSVSPSVPRQRDPFLSASFGDVLGFAEAKPRLSICVPSSPAWVSLWVFVREVAKIQGQPTHLVYARLLLTKDLSA